MSDKNKQLAEKICKYIGVSPITWVSYLVKELDEAYPEPPDEVTPPYIVKDCDCAAELAALKAEVLEAIKPFSAEYFYGSEDDFIILCADVYEPICTVGDLRRLAALCEKLEGK